MTEAEAEARVMRGDPSGALPGWKWCDTSRVYRPDYAVWTLHAGPFSGFTPWAMVKLRAPGDPVRWTVVRYDGHPDDTGTADTIREAMRTAGNLLDQLLRGAK